MVYAWFLRALSEVSGGDGRASPGPTFCRAVGSVVHAFGALGSRVSPAAQLSEAGPRSVTSELAFVSHFTA